MKNIAITVLVIFVALTSCHSWVFNTRNCSEKIPLYTPTKTVVKVGVTTSPTTQIADTVNETTDKTVDTTASWSNLNELLSELYPSTKIKKGNRHLLIIKSKRKHETDIRQLICDYWR